MTAQEYARAVVDSAPPLTAEQAATVRGLLGPYLPARGRDKTTPAG